MAGPPGYICDMQPLMEHRLELAGFTTRALELEGEGPPVVLLHGFGDSADTWRLVLDGLARRDRRALAVDLPGFGLAGRLAPGGGMLEQLDRFTRATVEHVAAEHGDVVLAGNSLGGCLSLRAAEDPTAPLCGVVPVSPAGFEHPVWFRVIESQPLVRALLAAPVPVPGAVVRAIVGEAYRQLAFARPRAAPADLVAGFTAHHATRSAVAGHLASGRRLLPELHDCFRLDRIDVPVLLVWGDRDRMVTHRGSRTVLDALPDTEYLLYEGIGHCPQLEAPDRLVGDLETFARALAPVAAS